MRQASDDSHDSAYGSVIYEIPDDAKLAPESSPAMSYSAASPNAVDGNDNLPNYQYLGQEYVNSTSNTLPRYSTSDLHWHDVSPHYSFIVPKGQEPYFELIEGNIMSFHKTPQKVYLDNPQ